VSALGRIPPLPFRKLDRLLRKQGFEALRQRGGHVFYGTPMGEPPSSPHRAGRDIPPGLVRKILADARLSADELDS
jgi:predicted RNA binding protein YcfA (HicA-like mRNA interferase family)